MKIPTTGKEEATEVRCLTPGEIAATVKSRREAAGIKQLTLAQLAGVTERTIQRLESGQKMDDQTLKDVATALGLTEDVFVARGSIHFEIVAGSGGISMKKHFQDMAAFDRWANEALLSWMDSNPENPELTHVMAHLIAENHPWLYVMRGESVPPEVHPEPNWTLEECRRQFVPTMDGLASFIASRNEADFGNLVRSSNPAGMVFENTIVEVLTNLFGHAEHHRGQMVSMIANSTGEYVPTMYMSYLRCRARD